MKRMIIALLFASSAALAQAPVNPTAPAPSLGNTSLYLIIIACTQDVTPCTFDKSENRSVQPATSMSCSQALNNNPSLRPHDGYVFVGWCSANRASTAPGQ